MKILEDTVFHFYQIYNHIKGRSLGCDPRGEYVPVIDCDGLTNQDMVIRCD